MFCGASGRLSFTRLLFGLCGQMCTYWDVTVRFNFTAHIIHKLDCVSVTGILLWAPFTCYPQKVKSAPTRWISLRNIAKLHGMN